jgi:hypothetical protein
MLKNVQKFLDRILLHIFIVLRFEYELVNCLNFMHYVKVRLKVSA